MSDASKILLPRSDRFRILWDSGLLALFIATALPQITGMRWHEWLGVVLVPAIIVHLTANWNWIVDSVLHALRRTGGEQLFNRIWDLLLFVAMTVSVVSGLLISRYFLPALGGTARVDAFWCALHETSATVVMIILGVHVAMHMRWALQNLRRI